MTPANRHGGNLREMAETASCPPEEILDFSASLNPLGFPDWLRPLIGSKISEMKHYPDPDYLSTRKAVGGRFGISPGEVVLGNGASEILFALADAPQTGRALLPVPCYSGYEEALRAHNAAWDELVLDEQDGFNLDFERLAAVLKKRKYDLVFLGHPNNPAGTLLDVVALKRAAAGHPSTLFVVDESFLDFCEGAQSLKSRRPENVAVLCSMTKILAVPGLRIGFAAASKGLCAKIKARIPPWSVSTLAAAVLEKSMEDEAFFKETRLQVGLWRKELKKELEQTGVFKVYPSTANFLLLKIESQRFRSGDLRRELLTRYRIGIRDGARFRGLSGRFVRAAVRTPEQNARLSAALRELFAVPVSSAPARKSKTPALMLQGTGSNVGKSVLAAALCRIFRQDGFRAAPFKSQNMALNSSVTPEGCEIAAAQALQAQAAGIAPDVRMNPVLLKPTSDERSQVIVRGKAVGHMNFRDYAAYKFRAFEEVKKCYDELASEYEAVVLEGAGSASEVNLKHADIVNMRMARHADARVLLVGNIDHGGIFGAFLGTLETLAEWERELTAGFILNRFRGTRSLLKQGVEYLEQYTGKKVFGIIPHIKNLRLPQEDSLEFKSGSFSDSSPLNGRIDIVLLDTPRISNHTDIEPLRMEEDVRLRLVRTAQDLGEPDVLLLPGSKNVLEDLAYLRESGLAGKILDLAQAGRTEIVGLCGGYQMLGRKISDPHGVETDTGGAEGLGLLPIETTFHPEKILSRRTARHLISGRTVCGYEIHHGVSRLLENLEPLIQDDEGNVFAYAGRSAGVWGAYLHGIFDQDEFRRWFLNQIRIRKGRVPLESAGARYDLEAELDRLASVVRESLDMEAVYRLTGLR